MNAAEVISLGEASLVGVGQYSTLAAVEDCMDSGAFDGQFVFVVKDCFDWNDERPHLSSVLVESGDNAFALDEKVVGANSPLRRMVDVYEFSDVYTLVAHDVELHEFLVDWLGATVEKVNASDLPSKRSPPGPNRKAVTLKKLRPLRPVKEQGGPNSRPSHTTGSLLLVPPTSFYFNAETAQDNEFMHSPERGATRSSVRAAALRECSELHVALTEAGVDVNLALNHRADAPDALFPNNWFSTHSDGTLVLYSMKAESRRKERLPQTIRRLKQLGYTDVVDFTEGEEKGEVLEGTGAMVLDRANKIAYVNESQRASITKAREWCEKMEYTLFDCGAALDVHGHPIYHTNVVMSVGTSLAIVCMASLAPAKQEALRAQFKSTGHTLVDITHEQMGQFCGNVLEVASSVKGNVLVMSEAAYKAFTPDQHELFKTHHITPLYANVQTIESLGGGGVRCCSAELF